MKKNGYQMLVLLTLLCSMLLLSACTAEAAAGEDTAAPAAEEQTEPTLESLLGEDYVDYLTETITMQMGNRMDKTPDVTYFPITKDAPLTDYAAIDETTSFYVDEDGNVVIVFPAGSVTDEANGEQSFRIPRP